MLVLILFVNGECNTAITPKHNFKRKFDDTVWEFLQRATGLSLPRTDEGREYECVLQLPVQRLLGRTFQLHLARLPISRGGLGLRSVAETAGPAFIGGLELALPALTGDTGVLPALEQVLERPDQGGGSRWRDLLWLGSRTGQELALANDSLRNDAQQCMDFLEEPHEGIFSATVDSIGGESTDGSTRSKIVQFQEKMLQDVITRGLRLHHDQNAHPVRKFHHRDKVSQAWLSALPTALSHIPSNEFQQAMAFHLLAPPPACAPHIGTMVCNKPLDAHGEVLMCAFLPFDTWRTRHDRIKTCLESMGNFAGAIVDPEPYGLFSHLIPAAAHAADGDLRQAREQQGLVPDLHLTFPTSHGPSSQQLAEIKCISAGLTYYHGRGKSVDDRANQLPAIYITKAKKIDRKYCGVAEDEIGPLQQRLINFGELQSLIWRG